MKKVIAIALVALGTVAAAQTPAPAAAAPSAAKRELINKVLTLQQPGIDVLSRQMAQPPAPMLQGVMNLLQTRVPADKREAVAKEVQADVRKYMDDATPIIRASAIKNAPSTVGTLLDQRFTEDELKQLISIMESPVNRKFQQLGPEMQKSLADKLVADNKALFEPKLRALEQTLAGHLGVQATPPGAPAKPASN